MRIFDNISTSYAHIPYTWKHKMAMIKLEKQFTGKVTPRILFHDTNKLFSFILFPFLTPDQHEALHQKFSKHHHYDDIANLTDAVREEIVLDWESARYTKPDKPRTAREWCSYKLINCYPYLSPIFDKWGI